MFAKIQEKDIQLIDVYACNVDDTLPTEGIGNGDAVIILDPSTNTSTVAMFDADSATWVSI